MTVKITRRENHAKAVQWTTQTRDEMLNVVQEWTDWENTPDYTDDVIRWPYNELGRQDWLVMDEVGNVDVYRKDWFESAWEVVA
ncbi:hypothetical protein CN1A_78 [Clavibacter phage CN1A]|uniref:Uncharacterized protein n=1 Tax=Clavibacter phage CN1A TaxID=1406793 RepID=U5PX67_9CAUD|nr:hypothetical protein CN1A_78 [Clavibacter phage CN1A]AGY47187.1 hypothetical protein CN1A_78 [Clavibacter phage CN1A]